MPILDDWLMPQTPQIKEPGAVASNRPALAGSSRFALREGLPNRFKTERLPLGTDALVQCISKRIDLSAQVLNAGLRKNLKITRKTIDDIFGQSDETVDSIQARLSIRILPGVRKKYCSMRSLSIPETCIRCYWRGCDPSITIIKEWI